VSLRILLVMDPLIPVPPRQYGGIERVVADLAGGLVGRGHEVTLWAAPSSRTPAQLEPFGREGEWTRRSNIRNMLQLARRFRAQPGRFDLVHNFGRLAYLLGALRSDVPKVQSYQRPVNPKNMRTARRLGAKRLHYTAVSAAVRDTALSGHSGAGDWTVIPNGVPPARYPFNAGVDPQRAPLVFLGRLDRCKGPHTAIAVARRLNRRLTLAGNVSSLPHERAYFYQEVAPLLGGGITYIGPVDDAQKAALLRGAAALLMPVDWAEPFGIVMVEALMTGTPVIAFRRGGIPEVILDGRTGFLCDTADEMVECVGRLPSISRAECRADAERRFSDEVIVSAYERLYGTLVGA